MFTKKSQISNRTHHGCDASIIFIPNQPLCLACGSTKQKKGERKGPHYASLRCAECDRFIKWEPKPTTVAKRQQQQQTVNYLLQAKGLTDREREFLETVRSKDKLLPRQQEVLANIEAKVGGQR